MESRILRAYTEYVDTLPESETVSAKWGSGIPSLQHLQEVRLIRSSIYRLYPQPACSWCNVKIDPADGWWTKPSSMNSGIFCEDCIDDHTDAERTEMKPGALRQMRIYRAVTMDREKPQNYGTGYRLSLVPKGVDEKEYARKLAEEDKRPRIILPKPHKEIISKIKPDTLPSLDNLDRRDAYLVAEGRNIDPAYISPVVQLVGDKLYSISGEVGVGVKIDGEYYIPNLG